MQRYREAAKRQKPPIIYQCQKEVGSHITQLAVLQQRLPNICGFHALSAVMNFDEKNPEKLLDQSLFVDSYEAVKQFIVKKLPKDEKDLNDYGQLHRIHLQILMRDQQQMEQLKDRPLAEFNFGFNYIQNSEQSLCRLEKLVEEFRSGKIDKVFILLGITVHWTLVVVTNRQKPHIYYIDSMNYPLYDVMKGLPIPISKEDSKENSRLLAYFQDLRRAMKILQELILRSVDFSLIKFENQLQQMLTSFAMVDQSDQKDVKKWFVDEYHPVVIRNDVLQPMKKCKIQKANPLLLSQLKDFLKIASKHMQVDQYMKYI